MADWSREADTSGCVVGASTPGAPPADAAAKVTSRVGTFASLRFPPFRLWFVGQLLSQTGFWFYVVTQALLVFELTRSGTMVGIVTAVQNIPLVLAPYAGALTDRVDTRKLILVSQMVTTLGALCLGVLVLADVITVAWVLVFAAVTGVAWAFDQPARRTFAAELVPEEAVTNAMSLNGVLLQMARMVGPALAAIVISSFGFGWGFIGTGIGTSVSLLALVVIGRRGGVFRSAQPEAGSSLRDGFRLAWEDRHVRVVLLLLLSTSTLAFNWHVLFPLFALRDLGGSSATYAFLMAAMAAGSMGGAFWMARRRVVGGKLLAAGACVYGVAQLCMAVSPTVGLAAATAVFLGLGTTVLVNGGAADLQLRVDKGMRGRMMGLFTLAVLGGVGLGAPLSGVLAEALGARVALAFGGTCSLVVGLLVLRLLRTSTNASLKEPRQ